MTILVIDDAPDIAEVVELCFDLRWPGTTVLYAGDGPSGMEILRRQGADIIVQDVGLPGDDGYKICREIRQTSQVPIVMLTVRDQDTDIARGLEAGADDYVTKPFSHIELLARAHAVLRLARMPLQESEEAPLTSGNLSVDFGRRVVEVDGRSVKLTPVEFRILTHLVKSAGRVVPHRTILRAVWGPTHLRTTNHLKVHIQHLRQKLGDEHPSPKMIVTEWKVGYRFVSQPVAPTPADEPAPDSGKSPWDSMTVAPC